MSNSSLYLSSSASLSNLSPVSTAMIPGPVLSLTYLGPLVNSLGLEVEVIRAGKFKSAVEPLVRSNPSKETLEMYQSMEKSLRDHLVQRIAVQRQIDSELVRGWLRRSFYTAEQARINGIVDSIEPFRGFERKVLEQHTEANMIALANYLSLSTGQDKARSAEDASGVGLIRAAGEILMVAPEQSSRPFITPSWFRQRLSWMKDSDKVKAVVIRIRSPGGSALASEMIWSDLQDLATVKPVIVSMGDVAASGGYYIASAANEIYAHPQTITGSIGVIYFALNGSNLDTKYGLHFHTVTDSERRRLFNFGQASSTADRQQLSMIVDDIYASFINRVASSRGKTSAQVDQLAQGRVYTGLQARDLGLVDQLGGLPEALQRAKVLGGLDPDKLYPILQYQDDQLGLLNCLRSARDLMRCLRFNAGSGVATSLSSLPGI